MTFLDPGTVTGEPLVERSYADACDFTWDNIWPNIYDRFALAHFLGWFLKSLILRDAFLCWVISIGWEFIEIIFTHMLPNFAECWWDQWLLDVLICNGLGIAFGTFVQKYFHMMQHNWRVAYSHPTYTHSAKKLIRAFHLDHLDPTSSSTKTLRQQQKWSISRSLKRFFGIQFIVLLFQTQELNAFFLKQLLYVPPESFLNPLRLVLWALFSTPCVRQLYLYMTNPNIHSMGRQTFLSITCLCTELMIIFKFGRGEFPTPMPEHIKHLIILIAISYIIFVIYGIMQIIQQHPHRDVHSDAFETISNYQFSSSIVTPDGATPRFAPTKHNTYNKNNSNQHHHHKKEDDKNVFDVLDDVDLHSETFALSPALSTTTTTATAISSSQHILSKNMTTEYITAKKKQTIEFAPIELPTSKSSDLQDSILTESQEHKLMRRRLKDPSRRNVSPRERPLVRKGSVPPQDR